MAQVLVTESHLEDIADAIREKRGSESTYTPAQMAGAIESIRTADDVVIASKAITANGTYNASSDNADGYNPVSVNVPNSYSVSDEGKVVSNGSLVSQTSKTVTQNGTYDTTENDEVIVNVSGGGGTVEVIEDVVPVMNSNTTPSGVASASSSLNNTFVAFKAFDKIHAAESMQGGWLASASDYTPYLQYEFDKEYELYGIKIWTANNGETASRDITIEGRKNGVWENALKSGQNVTLTFTQGTYGNTEQEYDILLNNSVYDAIRITGNDRFYLGANMSACTFAEVEVYARYEVTSHSDW